MIARFVYTDCRSSGPYASGVGKKFKSVVVLESTADVESLKDRLPKNSLTDGYQLPAVPDSLTMAEFDALPKSWAFAQITADTFAFARISTAGECYGRNNRFDEGFVFDSVGARTFATSFADKTSPLQPRPVDLVHSSGWLNPRGEEELEATKLENQLVTLSPNFLEQFKSDLTAVRSSLNLDQRLALFAQAQLDGSACCLPEKEGFYAHVSVFSRLTSPVYAWQLGFSDVWLEPRAKTLVDSQNPHFIANSKLSYDFSPLAALWGALAYRVFSNGFPGKLVAKIDELAPSLKFDPKNFAQGLAMVPLAIIELAKTDQLADQLSSQAQDFLKALNQPQIGYVS